MGDEYKKCEEQIQDKICTLKHLEWDDITEWANHFVLKVERLKKIMTE